MSRGKIRLAEPIRYRHRVIPVDEMNVPQRAVVELGGPFRDLFQDVERRVSIEKRRIESLSLWIGGTGLAVDKRN